MVRPRRRNRCRFCEALFSPDPRLKSRQFACSKPQCQKARKRANDKQWLEKHPGYFRGRYYNTKAWLKAHPGYLKGYRRDHPEAVERDNDARKKRRSLAKELRADIQDSRLLEVPILKALKPHLQSPPGADIQDSSLSQAVFISVVSPPLARRLRRRYTRLDRPAEA